MVPEPKKIAEQALVELAFAQAEIALNGVGSETMARVLEHIRHAKSCLKAIAPEYAARGRGNKAA
jgi:hypothetical protein